jgi:glutamine cyclotransferase
MPCSRRRQRFDMDWRGAVADRRGMKMPVSLIALAAALLSPIQAAASAANKEGVDVAEVVRVLPHDTSAFTEGLFVQNGTLYESTGREGQSFIRSMDLATGRILRSATVPSGVFGEGIVAWGNTLFSVVWHGGTGYRWSLPALKRTGSFRYTGEGWGMTQDGRHLILSDGTPTLRFLDPKTLAVVRKLPVTWQGKPLKQLNELEYVDGQILANVWMTPLIARIDAKTGNVTGWIDLSPLVERVALTDPDSVPNGIAWDARQRRLYVTGKNWPSLFEIRLPSRR